MLNEVEVVEPRYECNLCRTTYKRKESLSIHIGIHYGFSPYTCSICSKNFTQKVGLEKHQRTHSGEPLYKVGAIMFRELTFKGRQILLLHYRSFELQCDYCDRRFLHEKTYKNHLTNHNGKKYVYCSVCRLGFTSRVNLERHSRSHTKEKPFICEICGQRFSQSFKMYAHIRSIHEKNDPKRTKIVEHQSVYVNKVFLTRIIFSSQLRPSILH